MKLFKVDGVEKPVDLVTKRLNQVVNAKHLMSLGMSTGLGRAATATLNVLGPGKQDEWVHCDGEVVRVH